MLQHIVSQLQCVIKNFSLERDFVICVFVAVLDNQTGITHGEMILQIISQPEAFNGQAENSNDLDTNKPLGLKDISHIVNMRIPSVYARSRQLMNFYDDKLSKHFYERLMRKPRCSFCQRKVTNEPS